MPDLFIKDPEATLDYLVNWAAWLGDDTITDSTWTVATGITKDSDTFDATSARIWLSGGTVGAQYALTNHIVTAGGRQDDRTICIVARDK